MDSEKCATPSRTANSRKAWPSPPRDSPNPQYAPPSPSDFRPSQETQDRDSAHSSDFEDNRHRDGETLGGGKRPSSRGEDQDPEAPDFSQLRKRLADIGIPPYREKVPSLPSLAHCLSQLLSAHCQLQDSQRSLLQRFHTLAEKHKALLASAEELHDRVAKYKARSRELNLNALQRDLEGEGKPLEVFKNFFRRDFRPHSDSDTKTMALIILYENRLKKVEKQAAEKAISAAQGEHESRQQHSNQDLVARLLQEKVDLQRQLTASPGSGYDRLHQLLGSKDAESAFEVASKMQAVIKSLPRIESFVKQVCLAVFPSLESYDHEDRISIMDRIIPTLHEWREKLRQLDAIHRGFCKVYRLDPEAEGIDTMVGDMQMKAATDDADAVTKFGQLFEVGSREDTKDMIEQVFMFVHHTTAFLKVSRMQEAKYLLGIDTSEPSEVFARTLKELEARLRKH